MTRLLDRVEAMYQQQGKAFDKNLYSNYTFAELEAHYAMVMSKLPLDHLIQWAWSARSQAGILVDEYDLMKLRASGPLELAQSIATLELATDYTDPITGYTNEEAIARLDDAAMLRIEICQLKAKQYERYNAHYDWYLKESIKKAYQRLQRHERSR